MADNQAQLDDFIEVAGYDPTKPAGSSWGLDSLFKTITQGTNAASNIISTVGNSKAAIANAKSDAQLRNLQLTTGQPAGLNTSTLQKLLPWILGFGALIVAAIVVLPLLKSSSK